MEHFFTDLPRRGLLLTGASVLVLAALAPVAGAQAAGDEPYVLEEIIVTGVRASLKSAIDMKRASDAIVDGISSEDVGKFPDANIAEALQRIPGVSIDRSGGEGRYVSIDGLGPDFANVLFNGRPIASENPGRSFSFDTVASDLIGNVLVYKSQPANVPEGGVGGTVDIVTAKPFDFKGFTFAGNVSANYEENSRDVTPQISFVTSNRFYDGRLGILASFVHQERKQRTYDVQNSGMIHNLFFDADAYAYVSDDRDEAWRMQDLTRSVVEEKRSRTGGTLAVQFEATEDLTLGFDYLYSKFNVTTEINSASNWFWAVQDTNRNVIDTNGSYTTFDHGIGYDLSGYAFNLTKKKRPTTTQLGGFNAAWEPSDSFKAVFDASYSTARNDNRGLDESQTLEILNQPGFLVHMDGGVPWFDQNGNLVAEANERLLRARINKNSGAYIDASTGQAKLDTSWQALDNVKLDIGAAYVEARKTNENWETPLPIQRLYQANAMGQVIDYAKIVKGIYRGGDKFGNDKLNADMFMIDGDALRAWMADPVNLANRTRNASAGGLADFIANGRSWKAVETGDSFEIKEKVTSGYASVKLDDEIADMPVNVTAGLRMSHTELTSTGRMRVLTGLAVQAGDNPGVLYKTFASNDLTQVSAKNSYTNWLPSLNVKLDVHPDVVLRGAVSRTMTRPTLEDLAPQISYGSTFVVARYATGSNPNLKPFLSTNFDASAEWYFADTGALALGYFRKKVDNFIVQGTAEEVIASVANPAYQTFIVTRPVNAEKATIEGINASFTYAFDMGFGVQANYTHVTSNATLDKSQPNVSFALPGLSDTANLVGFYEQGPFSARLAYNWRSDFLGSLLYNGSGEPQYFAPYHQIDARLGYQLTQSMAVTATGVNLTKEKVKANGRYENQFLGYTDYGRRFTLMLSVKL